MFARESRLNPLAWIPAVQGPWWSWRPFQESNSVPNLIRRGYEEINKGLGLPFRIRYWSHDYIILPEKYLKDLKTARKDHASFSESIQDVFFLRSLVGDLFKTDRMVYTIKKGLNPHLNEATELCISEAEGAFRGEMGNCESWSSLPVLDVLCGIAHRISSRILVGEEVCRDPAFQKASADYFQGHASLGFVLLHVPVKALRNMLKRPFSYFQRRRQRRVLSLVSSVMKRRLEARSSGEVYHEQNDCMDWTLKIKDNFPESESEGPLWQMSHELIHLLGASHAPTGMALTQMLWLLLDKPEYFEPLRKEAEEAISQFGMTIKVLNHLPLQDSFIRETSRLYSNKVGIPRRIMGEPFTFHDGFTIPAGTRIAFPVDQLARDPDIFPNPETFDGFRYFRFSEDDARTEDGVNQWKASHAHQRNLVFGYGTHVCPGRFFAVRLMKIIFTKLLVEYDIRSEWPQGGIPPSFFIEGSAVPHTTASISFRRRSAAGSEYTVEGEESDCSKQTTKQLSDTAGRVRSGRLFSLPYLAILAGFVVIFFIAM
ncbi:cytochrome P450 [Xylariaceae sp. AK1471]|nr:cytochrome P450 [Xylariaceae sp. AK1471]